MVQLVGTTSLGLGKLIDGKNQFVHIRYSAHSNGSNMTTEIQADTKYIGIATNSSETAPTSPSDYSWGRFVGTPGTSSYTWIRYSSNADGSNMTTIPNEETKYIGVAVTAEDSAPTDYTRYSWALFKGSDGRGVKKTEVSYQKSTSGTVIPAGAWLASIPSVSDGEYLWTRTLFTYTDGTTTSTYNVSRNGISGLGIARADVHYQKSTSGTTVPIGTWTVTIPAVEANEYLWTRTTITYTDDSTSVSYSVGKMGADGKDAQLLYLTATSEIQAFDSDDKPKTTQPITISAKLQNASGTATFVAIPYIGNTAQTPITLGGTGNDRTLLPSQWTDPKWTIVAITATLGSLTDTISVNKVKDGESGETPVVHIAWADSADGSEGFALELPTNKIPKYRGYYVDYSTVASTDPKKYKWERNPDDTGAEVDKAMTAVESAVANAEEAERLAATASQTATIAKQEASAAQNAASMAQGEVSRIEGVIVGVQGDIDTALQEVADQAADLQATKETLELNYAKKTEVSDVQAALTTEISKKVGELQTTVSQTYAAKNDVVSMEGRLQSQITQTAGEVSSVVGKVDKLEADTTEAQKKVDEALEKSAAAQAAASQAQANADAADKKVTAAQTDLNEAKQNLVNTINRVDATEADIAEAQLKVESAQAAVAQAQKDAAEAALAASNAQAAANKAQQDVAALTKRVVSAETAITQNSEQIQLAATRTEEIGDELKNNYYTKEQADAAITVKADSITQTVSSTYATKGNTIKSTVEEFYQSTSPTALSGGSWSTTQPTWVQGKYIWRRTKNTYGNDTVAYTPSVNGVCITGNTGASGQNGKGVSSYSVTYQVGTSGTTAPTGTWTTTIPTVPQGQYLWTKMVITYTDNTSSTSYSVSYIPVNGQAGATGNGVSSIITEFYLSTSKTTQTGGSWSTTQPTWSPGKYVWTRNKITYTNGSTAYTSPQCSSEWEAVNNIQVGGRNLLKNTGSDSYNTKITKDTTSNIVRTIYLVDSFDYNNLINKTVVLSFRLKNDGNSEKFDNGNETWMDNRFGAHIVLNWKNSSTGEISGSYPFVELLFQKANNKRIYSTFTFTPPNSSYDTIYSLDVAMQIGYKPAQDNNSEWFLGEFKLEIGNKPTDWSPAPEDMATAGQAQQAQNDANDANSKADATEHRVSVAESTIKQLSDSISTLVTDSNGSSMMTQTSDGWTFNIGSITSAIDSATNNIDNLSGSLSQTNNVVNNLNNLANDLSKKTAYINMTTDETGAPCIELGKSGNAFKVRITNTSVDFIEGSSKIAYVSNQALFIEKAIIKSELQVGERQGFIWKTRSNGNMGLRWFG